MERRMSKKEKRLLRSLLLTILERSAVARATSGTRDWYLEQRSSGIATEDLMFGTHLASTNTSHLFSSFPDTLPASSLQPTPSPYHQTPPGDGGQSAFIAWLLFRVSRRLSFSACIRCSGCLPFCIFTFSTVAIVTPVSCLYVQFLRSV